MSTQPLKAAELPLKKVFTEDYQFVIPEYQRPYAWGEEEARQLLSDLEDALERDSTEPYFLGSIVLVKGADSRAEVIDGQQRLTTLTILLATMRDLATDPELSSAIHTLIEEPAVLFEDKAAQPRLTLRPKDNDFFRAHVQTKGGTAGLRTLSDNLTVTDSQKRIRDNAVALHTALKGWPQEELLRLYKMLGTETFVVVVSTPEINSAYRIFSVMNARGMPLAPADIFKSKVIGAIPDDDRERYANVWEGLEQELGRSEFGDLFLYVRSIFSKTRAVRSLLQEFQDQVLKTYLPHNGVGFIKEVLEPYAEADRHLLTQDFHGGPEWSAVNNWLRMLNELDNDDWRPVALWALRHHGDDAPYLAQFFRQLERLAASMLIRRVYATPRSQRYLDLLKQLDAHGGLESSAFQLTPTEKDQTRRMIDGDLYMMTRIRRYVLLRLDALLADNPGATYDHKIITVEHVLPQNPKADSQWQQDFTEEERTEWTHRLGNLLLLNRRKNSQAQNYDFAVKKQRYFLAGGGVPVFALTTQVVHHTEWTPDTIRNRQEQLLGRLTEEWNL